MACLWVIMNSVLLTILHGHVLKRGRLRGQARKDSMTRPSRKRTELTEVVVIVIRHQSHLIEPAIKRVSLDPKGILEDDSLIVSFTVTFGLETVVASWPALVTLDASFSTCCRDEVRGYY